MTPALPSLYRNSHLHPQRASNPHDCGKTRVAIFGQRLIKPFASHSGFTRQAAHVLGPRNVIQRNSDQAPVPRVFLSSRFEVVTDILLGTEMVSDIPSDEFFSHYLPPFFSQSLRAPNVALLAILVSTIK